jgi:hypothetical protein
MADMDDEEATNRAREAIKARRDRYEHRQRYLGPDTTNIVPDNYSAAINRWRAGPIDQNNPFDSNRITFGENMTRNIPTRGENIAQRRLEYDAAQGLADLGERKFGGRKRKRTIKRRKNSSKRGKKRRQTRHSKK